MLQEERTSTLLNLLCALLQTFSNGVAKSCLNGIQYQFQDIISEKPEAQRYRKSPLL